ncbi:hypothetical protein ABJI51_39085 [Amycolatopsis sp. NEAU-NG30]|uniref:Uncharacterized protein n=1 Tax=Amycolatopsis melonis TaxID=3156488 RepID=A0ABV0LUP8_9PSEU
MTISDTLLRVDGEVLRCTHGAEVTVRFPGFTDAQNAGTLTESDQARIQQRIDELAATVPESARPRHAELLPLSGAALAWTGVALLVAEPDLPWSALQRVD